MKILFSLTFSFPQKKVKTFFFTALTQCTLWLFFHEFFFFSYDFFSGHWIFCPLGKKMMMLIIRIIIMKIYCYTNCLFQTCWKFSFFTTEFRPLQPDWFGERHPTKVGLFSSDLGMKTSMNLSLSFLFLL